MGGRRAIGLLAWMHCDFTMMFRHLAVQEVLGNQSDIDAR